MTMRRSFALCLVVCGAFFAACRTVPVAAPPQAVTPDLRSPTTWTTPRDWNEQPGVRLERAPAATWRSAQEPDLEFEVQTALLSKYVWRGQLLTDDPVLQPSATVSYAGWSFTAWGNLELTDVNDDELEFSEVDLLLEYERSLQGTQLPVDVFVGAGWYAFPSTPLDATFEFYGGLALDVALRPRVTLYYDIAEVEGVYLTLDVGHEVPLAGGTLALAGSVGWGDNRWNQFSWGTRTGGLNDLLLTASWTVTSGGWTFTPSIAWSALLDGDIRASSDYEDNWIFGLSAAFSF